VVLELEAQGLLSLHCLPAAAARFCVTESCVQGGEGEDNLSLSLFLISFLFKIFRKMNLG
jgi:hypothetical protein